LTAATRTAAARVPAWVLGSVGLAGLAAVIEAVPRLGLVSPRYLPPFSRLVAALAEQAGRRDFWLALGETLRGWAIGLAVAVVAGVVVGLVIGSVPGLRAVTGSTIEFLRPIPSVALIPLAVLLFGTDLRSTLLLVVYAAFWQVLVQVLAGVADVDPVAAETARSYRLGAWARLRHLTWPTALPYLLTGVRLAAAVALVLAVTAELVIGSPGLGREIATAQSSNAVPTLYALVLVTGLVGIAVNALARLAERRLLAWHPSVRG
jgi:ABC-type nitrate/sulfonate/bicarbonate transport system permease component